MLSPFNVWLILRGLVTLLERTKKHSGYALMVVRYLESHPRVARIFSPGLESRPHHKFTKREMPGFSGMLTFQLKGGLGTAINMANKIHLIQYATSLSHAQRLLFNFPVD